VKLWEVIFVMLIGAAVAQEQPPLTEDQRKAQELLKKTVEERQKHQAAVSNAAPRLTQAEIEQQYLAGKITAKQFQQYLRQQPPATTGKPQLSPEKQAEALQMLRALTLKTNTPSAAAGKVIEPNAEPANPAITDVESKIRELEKAKEAREKGTNAPAAAPKTKREKLDALLKQFVDGKISDAEYKQQRAKLISEPD